MAPSPEPQPGDWHETLVDLLALDRGIPEDRAHRFLARHAEEVRAAAPDEEALAEARAWARHGYEIGQRHCGWTDHGVAPDWLTEGFPPRIDSCSQAVAWEEKYFELAEKRTEALAAIDRVQKVSTAPEAMNTAEPDDGSYLRGYKQGVLATKSALRSPTESAVSPSDTATTSVAEDHPCERCGHRKAAHINDPVWCRSCPADTSHTDNPGWHEYKPAEDQQ